MKTRGIRIALECLRGSVSTESDAVELNGQLARATDGSRWAEATLPEPISPPITIPYSKIRLITKNLGEDDQLELKPDGAKCLIEAPSAKWELNLLSIEMDDPPAFEPIKIIETSGYQLLEAYKGLKHLMSLDLSDPGLMWAWTSENQELVVVSGYALGAYPIGAKDLEIPLMDLMILGRILAIHQSEKVTFNIGEKYFSVVMRDFHFQSMLPSGAKFKGEWYTRAKNWLTEDPQVIKTSRSSLRRALDLVGITAGESQFSISSLNGTVVLDSVDEQANKSTSKIEALGKLKEPINLNLKYVNPILDALTDELITLTVCKSGIVFSDKKFWEMIFVR